MNPLIAAGLGCLLAGCSMLGTPEPPAIPALVPVAVQVQPPIMPGECFRKPPPFVTVPIPKDAAKTIDSGILLKTLDKGAKQYDGVVAEKQVCAAGLDKIREPAVADILVPRS